MAFTLDLAGGWFDLPAATWAAGADVVEDHLVALNSLIRFAATCDEYLVANPVKDGDTVQLGASADDGYSYSRSEALTAFAMVASPNPSNGANGGPGNLLQLDCFVDQDTGLAHSAVDYYVQGGDATSTTNGLLAVLLMCRRGAGNRTAVARGTGGGAAGGGGGVATGGSGVGSVGPGGDGDQGDQGDGRHKVPKSTF